MNIGWFDAFRENGAPTWYGENATPVVLDLKIAGLLSAFVLPTLAFLLVLPGIRRFRALSSFTFLFSMAIGATILVSIHYPGWHAGQITIFTTYRSHSAERINSRLGVSIGLTHVNITLRSESLSPEDIVLARAALCQKLRDLARQRSAQAVANLLFGASATNGSDGARVEAEAEADEREKLLPEAEAEAPAALRESEKQPNSAVAAELQQQQPSSGAELYYNERFDFDDVSGMEVMEWLEKGLPYPILQAIEYLSADRTDFLWGKEYRHAGYYTYTTLWFAFSLWLLSLCLLALLPHLFGRLVLLTGLTVLVADSVYCSLTPADLFLVFLGPDEHSHRLTFHPASCFYATLCAGLACTAVGAALWFLEARTAFRLDTVFSACIDDLCRRPRAALEGARRRRFRFWHTRASASRLTPAAMSRRRVPHALGGGGGTPWGSLTSVALPAAAADQQVGWKRRRRTLRREARELDVYELQRRGGLRKVSSSAANAGGNKLAGERKWPFRLNHTAAASAYPLPEPTEADNDDDDDEELPSGSVSPTPSEMAHRALLISRTREEAQNALNGAIAAAVAASAAAEKTVDGAAESAADAAAVASSTTSEYCSNASTSDTMCTPRASALLGVADDADTGGEEEEAVEAEASRRSSGRSRVAFHAPSTPAALPRSDRAPVFNFDRRDAEAEAEGSGEKRTRKDEKG